MDGDFIVQYEIRDDTKEQWSQCQNRDGDAIAKVFIVRQLDVGGTIGGNRIKDIVGECMTHGQIRDGDENGRIGIGIASRRPAQKDRHGIGQYQQQYIDRLT